LFEESLAALVDLMLVSERNELNLFAIATVTNDTVVKFIPHTFEALHEKRCCLQATIEAMVIAIKLQGQWPKIVRDLGNCCQVHLLHGTGTIVNKT
jgi:hypothetical protein